MFKHFIAISSLYSEGMRIAWHSSSEKLDFETIKTFLNTLKKKHGDIQLGIHQLTTDGPDWDSVTKADSYFSDLIVIQEEEKFIELVGIDQKLSALDVAKFILSIEPISHLKLQKLLYLTYERFLKNTGERLFPDQIFAWKHGPVIETVYSEFKTHGADPITSEEEDSVLIYSSDIAVTPSFMKMVSSEHGKVATETVISIIKDYKSFSAWELVDLTHQEGTPWKKVHQPGVNKLITDEIILAYS